MIKNQTTIAAISVALTLAISSLFGFAGSSIIGTFWGWFWISLLIIVIGFAAYNSYLIQKDILAFQKAEIDALEYFSKFSIKLTCAYCKQTNVAPIQLNQRNTFKCEGCNQVNGISMQFIATTLTTPVESVKIPTGGNESIEFKVS